MVDDHIAFLLECVNKKMDGITEWNKWRKNNPDIIPKLKGLNFKELNWHPSKGPGIDFSKADLSNSDFTGAMLNYPDFINANLTNSKFNKSLIQNARFINCKMRKANFEWAVLNYSIFTGVEKAGAFANSTLQEVNFDNCMLRSASFIGANLRQASFVGADLSFAYLTDANLLDANLTNTNLTKASMQRTRLINTSIEGAIITEAKIYGISAWNLKGKPKSMNKLVITADDESEITVDDIDIAQFIHLLLKREKLRNVINTITSKAVLILGRFTIERKAILDSLADELRKYNLLPIIFDFEKATSRDFTETIKVLAGLSFFVIADITDPSAIPLELQATVPDYQIPFITIIEKGKTPFSMFKDLQKFPWMFSPLAYSSMDDLIKGFKEIFIDRAFEKQKELAGLKENVLQVQTVDQYLKENKT